jgi:peptide/nickel transport system permease protein
MTRYLFRRVALAVPVWIGMALLVFILAQLAPGDPAALQAQAILGRPATSEEIAAERVRLGLDRPAPVRFASWLGDVARGDFGQSYRTGEPVTGALRERMPRTLLLAVLATALSVAIAAPLGIACAIRPGSMMDHAARALSLAGASMPSYWLGYVLIFTFAVRLHWLPVAGAGTWRHAILPSLTLAFGSAAIMLRLVRTEALELLGQDHVAVARAKGLPELQVLTRHVLRAVMIPLVTLVGLQFGNLLSGAVIIETVFNWPGMGRLAVDAIGSRDYPTIQAVVVVSGTIFLALNLAIDLLYTWADPRVRLPGS